MLAAIENGTKPGRKPAQHQPAQKPAAAAPKAGKESAAEQQSQKDAGRPAKAVPAKQQQEQPPQQRGPGRPWVPDSQIRALLANQMLVKGEPIPAKWLQDWVGVEDQQQAAQ